MRAEQNELVTRIGPGTPCGALMRSYWQSVALVDEFDPVHDPLMAGRPVKGVRTLGQDFVLFRNAQGTWGMLDRACPHRGADLSFGRNEGDGLRCPFHGWKFWDRWWREQVRAKREGAPWISSPVSTTSPVRTAPVEVPAAASTSSARSEAG